MSKKTKSDAPYKKARMAFEKYKLDHEKAKCTHNTVCYVMAESRYGADLDEAAFYYWIKRMPSIKSFLGVPGGVELIVDVAKFNDFEFRRLIALYYRYNLNFEELRIFINDKNKEWVLRPSMYWAARFRRKA